MMRSALKIPLAILLLACLLPAAGHLSACADQHSTPTDDTCSTVCCQPFIGKALIESFTPAPSEQFLMRREMVQLPIIASSPFRPPEPLS
jgi:hypothetical protein